VLFIGRLSGGGLASFEATRLATGSRVQGLRPRPGRARQADGRPPAASPCATGTPSPGRFDVFGAGTVRPSLAAAAADPMDAAAGQAGRGLRVLHQARVPLLHLPRRRHRPDRRHLRGVARNLERWSTAIEAEKMAATGRQAAVGHRQPVQPPALRRRRRDQPRPGGVRLRRRAGQARWRPPTTSAARTTCCGAAARATRPCSTPTSPARARSSPGS
jgi:hypothetical protein